MAPWGINRNGCKALAQPWFYEDTPGPFGLGCLSCADEGETIRSRRWLRCLGRLCHLVSISSPSTLSEPPPVEVTTNLNGFTLRPVILPLCLPFLKFNRTVPREPFALSKASAVNVGISPCELVASTSNFSFLASYLAFIMATSSPGCSRFRNADHR